MSGQNGLHQLTAHEASASASGALASTSSRGSDGRTSSGRITLSSGSGWEVGSTPSVSSAFSVSKWSRISESCSWNVATSSSLNPTRAN